LCIDDDDIGLQVRKLVLESEGYEVLLAESGALGLRLLAEQHVDCVVLDYRMPEMDGSVVAFEIKRKWPALPVILFSGFPDEIPVSVSDFVEATLSKADGPRPLLRELAKHAKAQLVRRRPAASG
jgi:CheY-like chemotaxis protein